MQQLGFRSLFAKLFASVMLALILFAVAMVLLTQLVHDKDASIRSEVVATQILGQIDPFLHELNIAISKDNRLQSRFMLAVVKKSFDIFDESLQSKMGLYDNQGRLLMQTDNSDLPLELPAMPSLLSRAFPSFSDMPPNQQAQVYSSTGYTLLYESRLPPKTPVLSAALNLFTGTLLLLLIMAGVLWRIARSMTWRINQMSQQMTELGDGDFSVRVNARGSDEIASLARGFNQAAQKIEHLINANSLLLAHASHELRTPITRIRLQIEMMDMLAGSMPTDTKARFDKRAQAINRDLSGLNDLVESILLVSRLDAGHVMQQVEHVDIYDLVNQERQHYSEATLIGEHIVIDGQPPLLTHLIRNLLTNAMLHGSPPVTVLLYGVQTIDEADAIPDYLLQSIVCSSFVDYNSSEYHDYGETLTGDSQANDEQSSVISVETDTTSEHSKQDATEPSDKAVPLPAPIIYRNGETLIIDDNVNSVNTDHSDDVSSVGVTTEEVNSNDINNTANSNTLDSEALTTDDIEHSANAAIPEDAAVIDSASLTRPRSKQNLAAREVARNDKRNQVTTLANDTPAITNNTLIHNYNKFTADLSDKIKNIIWKKAIWNIVPESQDPAQENIDDKSTLINAKSTDKNADNDNKDDNESATTPRKESLFTKHLKKSKPEPTRPLPKYAVLAVIDEGAGIPEDKREEIFSPFVRLQQKKKGSGLGLSLVSQIVTAHQGHIFTDTINGHTRFLVILPVIHDPHYRYNDNND